MNEDLITGLFRYFARFVPAAVLREIMIQPDASRCAGYAEIEFEVLHPELTDVRIPEIEKFVLSVNENFVSERIKNAKGFILFVEYGKITADFDRALGVKESIAITVAHSFSDASHDNLNEALLMNRCLNLLFRILRQMKADEGAIDFCPTADLLTMPVEIAPADPAAFYGCGGWSAMFRNAKTILL
jgi:hypothetical protein